MKYWQSFSEIIIVIIIINVGNLGCVKNECHASIYLMVHVRAALLGGIE